MPTRNLFARWIASDNKNKASLVSGALFLNTITYLSFQCSDAFFEGSDLFLRVALLLALKGYNSLRCIRYETLVRELLLHTCQETFEVLKLSFHLGNLCLDINHVA